MPGLIGYIIGIPSIMAIIGLYKYSEHFSDGNVGMEPDMTPDMIERKQVKDKLFSDCIKKIEAGDEVSISSASSHAYAVCIGDFVRIGWAEKCATRFTAFWQWKGPIGIVVDGTAVEPNGYTEEYELDWH